MFEKWEGEEKRREEKRAMHEMGKVCPEKMAKKGKREERRPDVCAQFLSTSPQYLPSLSFTSVL